MSINDFQRATDKVMELIWCGIAHATTDPTPAQLRECAECGPSGWGERLCGACHSDFEAEFEETRRAVLRAERAMR
jgi:hypothetical protein